MHSIQDIKNNISKEKLLTPKGLLMLLTLFTIVVQIMIIIYSNLVEIRYHLGYDASSAYLHAVEIWRTKSIVPSTYALTTTIGLDSSDPLAALLYGITGDIFTAFGLANIFFDIILCVTFFLLLWEFNLSPQRIALGFVFFLCPFMSPDNYLDNNLSYFAVMFGEQASYNIKVTAMLLMLVCIVRLEKTNAQLAAISAAQSANEEFDSKHVSVDNKTGKTCSAVGRKDIFTLVIVICSIIFNMLTSVSTGIYVAITILIPCLFYYVVKVLVHNSFGALKCRGFIYVWGQLAISFICKTMSSHIFSFESKENSMVLTGVLDFWNNLGALIMGYLRLLCGISSETSISVFSLRGILQILAVGLIVIMMILTVISVQFALKKLRERTSDITFLLPHIIILINLCIFIFSYTLYDGIYFECRYLIIVYLMQIIICAAALDRISCKLIFKPLAILALTGILLIESVGIFRYYHNTRVDSDNITPMIETIDSLDVPIAYSWGSYYGPLLVDGRDFRVMDLDVVYICMLDGDYNTFYGWGDYRYYIENGEWDGGTALITTSEDYKTLPTFLADKYIYVDTFGQYQLYVSDVNPFDLSAFKNDSDININYMYSDGVDILSSELTSDGTIITDEYISGNVMNMTLPNVNEGTYSLTLNMDILAQAGSGSIYFDIYNQDTGEVLAKSTSVASGTVVTVDNMTLDSQANIMIRCYQTSGISVELRNVTIMK